MPETFTIEGTRESPGTPSEFYGTISVENNGHFTGRVHSPTQRPQTQQLEGFAKIDGGRTKLLFLKQFGEKASNAMYYLEGPYEGRLSKNGVVREGQYYGGWRALTNPVEVSTEQDLETAFEGSWKAKGAAKIKLERES